MPSNPERSPEGAGPHHTRERHGQHGGRTEALDRDDLAEAYVSAWIDLGSVDTDKTERDDQVPLPRVLRRCAVPRATFKSTRMNLPERANQPDRG